VDSEKRPFHQEKKGKGLSFSLYDKGEKRKKNLLEAWIER